MNRSCIGNGVSKLVSAVSVVVLTVGLPTPRLGA